MTKRLVFHRGREHNGFHSWTYFRQRGAPRYTFLYYPTRRGVLIRTLDETLSCLREDHRPDLPKAKALLRKRADKETT